MLVSFWSGFFFATYYKKDNINREKEMKNEGVKIFSTLKDFVIEYVEDKMTKIRKHKDEEDTQRNSFFE